MRLRKLFPLLVLVGLVLVGYLIYCTIVGKPAMANRVGLIGWSPYNSNPLPAAPAPSSGTMGMRTF